MGFDHACREKRKENGIMRAARGTGKQRSGGNHAKPAPQLAGCPSRFWQADLLRDRPRQPCPLGGLTVPALTTPYRPDAEALALEQATAYVGQPQQLALDAPDGAVLAACEQHALRDGRALLRSTLAAALQGRAEAAEQKGGPPASAPRRTSDATRAGTHVPS